MKQIAVFFVLFLVAIAINAQTTPRGLNVNDQAPLFTSTDHEGKKITLEDELKKGPVVIVFYRGQWCPYCNKQLKKLEDSLALITAKGAGLIAITAENPANIDKTIEKTKASYPILWDDGLTIMKSYDVVYSVDEKTIEQYKGYGINFTEINGEKNGAHLPVPAIYVVGKDGKILYRHFNKDYTSRPSIAEILAHL